MLEKENNFKLYKFRKFDSDDFDNRSIFVNNIVTALINSEGGSINKALKEWDIFNSDIHEYVRNVYELIDTEIPFLALYDLKTANSYKDYDLESEEHLKQLIKHCLKYCKKYYYTQND